MSGTTNQGASLTLAQTIGTYLAGPVGAILGSLLTVWLQKRVPSRTPSVEDGSNALAGEFKTYQQEMEKRFASLEAGLQSLQQRLSEPEQGKIDTATQTCDEAVET